MSNPLFCAECGGDLKSTDNGYECLNCDKKYPQIRNDNKKKTESE